MRFPAGATPQFTRVHNLRLAVDWLRTGGPGSRADFARLTGLSKPTVSAIFEDLLDKGLVRADGATVRTGRPPVAFALAPEAAWVLVAEIGPDTCRALLAGFDGVPLAEVERPRRRTDDPRQEARRLRELLLRGTGVTVADLHGGVLAVHGRDGASGRTAATGAGQGTVGRETVAEPIQVRPSQLAAYAEHRHLLNAGREVEHLAFVDVADPSGVGLVLHRRPHLAARPGSPRPVPATPAETLARLVDALVPLALATGLETVVLGGSGGLDPTGMLRPLRAELARRLPEPPAVLRSALGDRAVLLGGTHLAVDLAARTLLHTDSARTRPLREAS
ncbi:crosslink repair DNA glycosylase YcaQ family protein [Kitasatospora sp. NPDC049285]|uniref:DNA glycosylase AlkZ-like family protein n=1 Tax=Kitasatospora sp. NPDC049285 TaxID=3157096 RepID=UPI003414D2B8